MTTVVAHPRLHFGLLDLGSATQRIFGGVGAALERPTTQVSVERSVSPAIISGVEIGDDLVRDLSLALERLADFTGGTIPVRVRLDSVPPTHVGLGSKTTALLAVLAAANIELGLGLDDRELQGLSGRGGTSGIGVHTFFRGGFVVDAGHRAAGPRHYLPSSAGPRERVPPVLASLPMPLHWEVALLLIDGVRWSAKEEQGFFLANTPIDDLEVDRAIAIACLDLAASVAEGDLISFATAIRDLQMVGFKRREIQSQPRTVQGLLEALHGAPAIAAGMSSVGPLVYAVFDRADVGSRATVVRAAADVGASVIATTQFANYGYQVT